MEFLVSFLRGLGILAISIVPVNKLAGTAVIGIVIAELPLKLCAVAVTPLNPINLGVVNVAALPVVF